MKLLILVAAILPIQISSNTPKHFNVEQLATGVWAVIHNDHYGRAICNAGIVDLGDKTIVFDPMMTPEAAEELKRVVMGLTPHREILVINSHFHNDHIRGNQAFAPEARIISTEWTRNKMIISEPDEQNWEKKNALRLANEEKEKIKTATGKHKEEAIMWMAYYQGIYESLPQLSLTLPDITFSDSLWIHGSQRSVKLVECRNGHTVSDVVMILQEEGIAFLGDLFFVLRHPWLGDGDADSWKAHLQRFRDDPSLSIYVPGHGPIGRKEDLTALENYISDAQRVLKEGRAQNLRDSAMIMRPIPAEYSQWWFGRFYPYNIRSLVRKSK